MSFKKDPRELAEVRRYSGALRRLYVTVRFQ